MNWFEMMKIFSGVITEELTWLFFTWRKMLGEAKVGQLERLALK